MNFSFLGLKISINKDISRNTLLTFDDINFVNNELLLYLKKLSQDEIYRRAKDVTCNSSEDSKKIKKILSDKGIVVIPNFINPSSIEKISNDLNKIKKSVYEFVSNNQSSKEDERTLYQKGSVKLSGYDALCKYKKSVVNVRQGQDKGMIDIFNVDKWKNSLGNVLIPYFKKKIISEIININNSNLKTNNLNLYINKEVLKTRGFHVDSYNRKIKCFVYLQDCISLECGPYTYVKGSHIKSPLTKINKLLSSFTYNETETPLVSFDKIVPVLAKKGSLVISDQGGSHRGLPQTPGNDRVVAVMNFV